MQTVRTNIKINASTQYTNFNYNSMCMFNGVVVGAGQDGVFRACCGEDDNGTPIDAYFIPHMTSFGDMNEKRCSKVYLGYQCDGSMQVSITGDEETTIGPYELSVIASKGQQRRRVNVGRGMAFTYATMKLENLAGSDFSVDKIQVFADSKKHGVK